MVFAGRLADQRQFRRVGAGAAVGAAGHADDDFLVRQSGFGQQFLDAGQDIGHDALGFRQGQAASRQGRAGHGGAANDAGLVFHRHAVFGQQAGDGVLVLRLDVDQQNVLRRRQAQFGLELLDHAAQAGFEAVIARVLDPAVLDEKAEKIFAVKLLVPAVKIALPGEFEGPRRLQFEAEPLFQFLAEPRHAALLR